jgi:hypothetical protein
MHSQSHLMLEACRIPFVQRLSSPWRLQKYLAKEKEPSFLLLNLFRLIPKPLVTAYVLIYSSASCSEVKVRVKSKSMKKRKVCLPAKRKVCLLAKTNDPGLPPNIGMFRTYCFYLVCSVHTRYVPYIRMHNNITL